MCLILTLTEKGYCSHLMIFVCCVYNICECMGACNCMSSSNIGYLLLYSHLSNSI